MTDAINAPVRRRRTMDVSNDQIAQPPSIDLGLEQEPNRGDDIQVLEAKHLEREYADRLAMDNDPITILIQPSSTENPELTVPVWVQGEGAEVFVNGKWMKLGFLPIGGEVITKRKYVEALGRARPVNCRTEVVGGIQGFGELPRNELRRNSRLINQFTVVEDRNPKGREWLQRLMAER